MFQRLNLTEAPRELDMHPHIAFLFTHGFAARMILRSGIARRLVAHGFRVTVISPNADETYFQNECQQEQVALCQEPQSTGGIADRFRTYRSYLLDDVMNNPALRTSHMELFAHRSPASRVTMEIINRTLAKRSWFRTWVRHIECRLNRSQPVKALLQKLQPDYLVFPNPFGTQETVYLIHARELGIPVICQMLSWDHVTAKGTPLLMPDYFISWGPMMTKELVDIYDFPRRKIYECGVPHFDVYFQKDKLKPRGALLQQLNLSPGKPYIFYGMVNPVFCPNELEILTWLVDRIREDAFIKPCTLIIRPHPQTIRGYYARNTQELARLYALAGPNVAIDTPQVLSDRLAWDMPKSDMPHLASLLNGSAMFLSAGSTLSLEACILDRPVINIGFDGREELPYERSARRGLDYIHITKLLAMGGVRVARSFEDLAAHINAYLKNPALDREARALSARQECGPQDGQATKRAGDALLQLCGRGRRHAEPVRSEEFRLRAVTP
jgi:CDP-glycerol glycerophosphotransferase (TagB/SpsB family)